MTESVFVNVPGTNGEPVLVRLPVEGHANRRWIERVRPALGLAVAALEFSQAAQHAELSVGPPAWLAPTTQRPAMYLILGDIALPVDPDPTDRNRLVARTVLTRDGQGRTERRLARNRRRKVRVAERDARRVARQRRLPNPTRPASNLSWSSAREWA
jgi:hypothetical protein